MYTLLSQWTLTMFSYLFPSDFSVASQKLSLFSWQKCHGNENFAEAPNLRICYVKLVLAILEPSIYFHCVALK